MPTRHQYDYRLFEEETESLVSLDDEQECEHMTPPSGKYELHWIRLINGDSRQSRMCCACYQALRAAGVAPMAGTWERNGLGGL